MAIGLPNSPWKAAGSVKAMVSASLRASTVPNAVAVAAAATRVMTATTMTTSRRARRESRTVLR